MKTFVFQLMFVAFAVEKKRTSPIKNPKKGKENWNLKKKMKTHLKKVKML